MEEREKRQGYDFNEQPYPLKVDEGVFIVQGES
jgi:hypothetical protein